MNSFKFSIIIAVYNVEKYLEESIKSVINQSIGFEENVQLILVDDGSTDNSGKIISEYAMKYPKNIVALSKSNGGQASARNYGLEYACGKYVNFLDSDDYFSSNTLEAVYSFFEEHYDEIDVVAISMRLFERMNIPHRLNAKFKQTRIIDLNLEPNNPQLSASSSFIKYDAIREYSFDTRLVNLEDALIINKIFLDKMAYGVLDNAVYYYRQRYDNNSTVDLMKDRKDYFIDRLDNFYLELINYCLDSVGAVPHFIQYLFVYDLQWMLNVNDLSVLDEDEKKLFWNKLYKVLDFIDTDCIVGNEFIVSYIEPFFVYLKNNMKMDVVANDKLQLISNGYVVDDFDNIRLWLDIVELKEGVLCFSGNIESSFNDEHLSIYLVKKSDEYETEFKTERVYYNEYYHSTLSLLDVDWKFRYNFDVNVPVCVNDEYFFRVDYDDGKYHYSIFPHISFREHCGLSTSSAFFVKNDLIMLFRFNRFNVLSYSYLSMLRFEFSNIRRLLHDKEVGYKHGLIISFLYCILYPFYKNRRIWIYQDRPEFADDNARYLFKYSMNKNDGVDKYYVLNESSDDFNEMRNVNENILKFGSYKHQLYFLFSEKIISSYVNEKFINPFYNKTPSLYRGMTTAKRYFLQHGVTKDNISEQIKKCDKNLSLITTVSEQEHDSFLEEGYNYDENIIQTLGFPRFDNLTKEGTHRQILFIPTWRLELDNENKFINSEYYTRLNSFFNNKDLQRILNEYDYKLVFKPHPEILKYIQSLHMPDYVQVSMDTSYQELFRTSSLMITDYSSVFFDFAYIKKPIIYYQNDDYHYRKGYFNYENMGFGKIVDNENDLMDLIEKYIENECIMEEKYQKRVLKFFKYHDKNNSKRVYEWILEDKN